MLPLAIFFFFADWLQALALRSTALQTFLSSAFFDSTAPRGSDPIAMARGIGCHNLSCSPGHCWVPCPELPFLFSPAQQWQKLQLRDRSLARGLGGKATPYVLASLYFLLLSNCSSGSKTMAPLLARAKVGLHFGLSESWSSPKRSAGTGAARRRKYTVYIIYKL